MGRDEPYLHILQHVVVSAQARPHHQGMQSGQPGLYLLLPVGAVTARRGAFSGLLFAFISQHFTWQ